MSSVNFKIAKKNCTNIPSNLIFVVLLLSLNLQSVTAKALEVDFSRRQVDFSKVENVNRMPASGLEDPSGSIVNKVLDGSYFESLEPAQDVVIMNTDKGFVPETVHLKKGHNYRVHIVNINNKEKNVSFVMDAFSEHHNTFYGEHKTFNVSPKVDGIFSFQCPETAIQGKLIVYSDADPASSNRKPASK